MSTKSKEKRTLAEYLANKKRRRTPPPSGKPKKFKVETYSSGKTKGAKPKVPAAAVRSNALSPIEQRLIGYAEAGDLPAIAVKYLALLGSARPVSKGLSSDTIACETVEDCVVSELRTYLAGNQVDVAVEVARLAVSPGNAVAARGRYRAT